jgi:hypothetical protein
LKIKLLFLYPKIQLSTKTTNYLRQQPALHHFWKLNYFTQSFFNKWLFDRKVVWPKSWLIKWSFDQKVFCPKGLLTERSFDRRVWPKGRLNEWLSEHVFHVFHLMYFSCRRSPSPLRLKGTLINTFTTAASFSYGFIFLDWGRLLFI